MKAIFQCQSFSIFQIGHRGILRRSEYLCDGKIGLGGIRRLVSLDNFPHLHLSIGINNRSGGILSQVLS